jgi:tRNA(fMet)-specific endonuclease VapC
MELMLDTNICIYLINERSSRVLEKLVSLDPAEVAISSVTLAELQYGVEKSEARERNAKALDMFVVPMEVLPFDADAARAYGGVRADLERRGKPIGGMDLMIAAHALSARATLVTNNTREFTRVRGLLVENWTRRDVST